MKIIYLLIEFLLINGVTVALFFYINRVDYSLRNIFLALLLRIPLGVILEISLLLSGTNILDFFDFPLYGLLLSLTFLRPLSRTQFIYFSLFPMVLWSLFRRSISYFIIPLFSSIENIRLVSLDNTLNDSIIYFLLSLIELVLVFLFLHSLKYDFIKLKSSNLDQKDIRLLRTTNVAMIIYYLSMESLAFLESAKMISTLNFRKGILVIYLIIFMGILKQLDTRLKEKLQEQLDFQQSLKLQDMERYSRHIESLYREVRGFRHDYANLLSTLQLAIEENNMNQVQSIYDTVLKDNSKKLRDHKFDLGRLVNIKESALKSLLAAKCLQAIDKNIEVNVEVPEPISLKGMELVDFITIIAILCDNAIEAATYASKKKINIAFFSLNQSQQLIIENSTQEEKIDISSIYTFGLSSKGEDRGVGLYNVMEIVRRYPNVSLRTNSHDYSFGQLLAIGSTTVKKI